MSRARRAVIPVILLLAAAFAAGTLAATLGQPGYAEDGLAAEEGGENLELMPGMEAGAGADGGAEISAPAFREEWLTIGNDTIRYRVCKDLTICYLTFTYPNADVTSGPPPLPGSLNPRLVELPMLPQPPTVGDARWVLLAFPLIGAAGTMGRRSTPARNEPPTTEPPPGPGPPPAPEVPTTTIPEPASILLLGTGLAGLALRRHRKRWTKV